MHALKVVTFIFCSVCLLDAFMALVRCFFFIVIIIVTVHDRLSPAKLPFAYCLVMFLLCFLCNERVCMCKDTCF